MDQQLIRQCFGIDISKESFTACVCSYYRSGAEQLTEVVWGYDINVNSVSIMTVLT